MTNGIVSSEKGFKDDNSTFQISSPIQPGNSGSPVFNDKGDLVGIVNSGFPSMDNVGYAIKMKSLFSLLKKSSIPVNLESKISSSLTTADKAKKLVDYIFLIEVEL